MGPSAGALGPGGPWWAFPWALGPGPWALPWALVGPCGDRALRGPWALVELWRDRALRGPWALVGPPWALPWALGPPLALPWALRGPCGDRALSRPLQVRKLSCEVPTT